MPSDEREWYDRPRNDRLVFRCGYCAVTVRAVANDTQAGIRLFCPECGDEMLGEYPDE